jgi:hypothetical protein
MKTDDAETARDKHDSSFPRPLFGDFPCIRYSCRAPLSLTAILPYPIFSRHFQYQFVTVTR